MSAGRHGLAAGASRGTGSGSQWNSLHQRRRLASVAAMLAVEVSDLGIPSQAVGSLVETLACNSGGDLESSSDFGRSLVCE